MMSAASEALFALVVGIERYLATLECVCPEVRQCRDLLAALGLSPAQCRPLAPAPDPTCGYLDEALALARGQGSSSLVERIEEARAYLSWTTYPYPGETIGRRFARAHAFMELVGCDMPFTAPDYSLGLFLVAPRTFYRDRRHRACELYAPLTGPTLWRFDHGGWSRRLAHEPVWNEPSRVHATLVEDTPFLCIYVWIGNVSEPAAVVPAPDWEEIEQRL